MTKADQIRAMLAEGKSSAEIAKKLNASPGHVAQVKAKMGDGNSGSTAVDKSATRAFTQSPGIVRGLSNRQYDAFMKISDWHTAVHENDHFFAEVGHWQIISTPMEVLTCIDTEISTNPSQSILKLLALGFSERYIQKYLTGLNPPHIGKQLKFWQWSILAAQCCNANLTNGEQKAILRDLHSRGHIDQGHKEDILVLIPLKRQRSALRVLEVLDEAPQRQYQ